LRIFVRLTLGCFFPLLLFWIWYCIAANYDYSALAGTYQFKGPAEHCVLFLRADGTFQQSLQRSGQALRSSGRWQRFGAAGVEFSKEFLTLNGQRLGPQGEVYAAFEKSLGLFVSLRLEPDLRLHRVYWGRP
jgi:hypothetical protein